MEGNRHLRARNYDTGVEREGQSAVHGVRSANHPPEIIATRGLDIEKADVPGCIFGAGVECVNQSARWIAIHVVFDRCRDVFVANRQDARAVIGGNERDFLDRARFSPRQQDARDALSLRWCFFVVLQVLFGLGLLVFALAPSA